MREFADLHGSILSSFLLPLVGIQLVRLVRVFYSVPPIGIQLHDTFTANSRKIRHHSLCEVNACRLRLRLRLVPRVAEHNIAMIKIC